VKRILGILARLSVTKRKAPSRAGPQAIDPGSGLRGDSAAKMNYYYRKLKSDFMMGVTVLATLVALVPLFLILGYLLSKGASSVNLAFFTHTPTPVGEPGGGMANAIVGTFELVGLACLLGVPVGIGAGLYLAEKGGRPLARLVRFAADVMMGVPSIVVGIFVYAVVVHPMGGFSALAGAAALAVIMIPLVTRTTEEMVALVPHELREAALALGVPQWRTTLSVVVRTALGGIATGVILAISRVAGETAPLLFTAFGNQYMSMSLTNPIASLTVQVYTYAISPFPDWQRQAWAGALVLTGIVLALELGVRWVTRGSARIAR
jgi:phosphate transport system permease protein